jgi:hypothetical protein
MCVLPCSVSHSIFRGRCHPWGITVLDASHVPVAKDETFEELLNNPGLLPVADVENGNICCVVLFKATVLAMADGKFRVQPIKIIKIASPPLFFLWYCLHVV